MSICTTGPRGAFPGLAGRMVELDRYVDALMRHTLAFVENHDSVDEESGLHHYKHMACNMAFICEMMGGNEK